MFLLSALGNNQGSSLESPPAALQCPEFPLIAMVRTVCPSLLPCEGPAWTPAELADEDEQGFTSQTDPFF